MEILAICSFALVAGSSKQCFKYCFPQIPNLNQAPITIKLVSFFFNLNHITVNLIFSCSFTYNYRMIPSHPSTQQATHTHTHSSTRVRACRHTHQPELQESRDLVGLFQGFFFLCLDWYLEHNTVSENVCGTNM